MSVPERTKATTLTSASNPLGSIAVLVGTLAMSATAIRGLVFGF